MVSVCVCVWVRARARGNVPAQNAVCICVCVCVCVRAHTRGNVSKVSSAVIVHMKLSSKLTFCEFPQKVSSPINFVGAHANVSKLSHDCRAQFAVIVQSLKSALKLKLSSELTFWEFLPRARGTHVWVKCLGLIKNHKKKKVENVITVSLLLIFEYWMHCKKSLWIWLMRFIFFCGDEAFGAGRNSLKLACY